MPTVQAGQSTDIPSAKTLKGTWWLPSTPEHTVGGVLEFRPGQGGDLEVQGELGGADEYGWPQVILGSSEGKAVTICDGYSLGKRTWQGTAAETVVERWSCYTVLVGSHEPDGYEAAFAMATLETVNLPGWTGRPKPRVTHESGKFAVAVELPSPFTSSVEDLGELRLEWSSGWSDGGTEASVNIDPGFRLIPERPMSLRRMLEDFVTPMLYFVSLATGSVDRASEWRIRSATFEEDPYRSQVVVWSAQLQDVDLGERRRRTNHHWEHLLPFEAVAPRFGELMPAWLSLFQSTRGSVVDYFSLAVAPFMYAEERFARMVRCLESWHRVRIGGEQVSADAFEALLAKAKAALDADEWRVVADRLRYANERTLKQRLDATIEDSAEPLRALVNSYRKFSRRVVDTRNSLAHSGVPGAYFTIEELTLAERTLEQVFRNELLKVLGVPQDSVAELLTRTPDWRLLSSDDNPLRRK